MTTDRRTALTDELIAFIHDEVATADDPIDRDTDLLLTGLVDSLGVIRIVNWMEDRLAIEIPPTDVVLDNFQFVWQMIEYAARRGAVAAA